MGGIAARSISLLATIWVLLPLILVVLALRLYLRIIKNKNQGWDDAAAVVAGAMMLFVGAEQTYMVTHGLGKHSAELPDSTAAHLIGWQWGVQIQLFIGFFAARLSVHLFLFRLISRARTWTRWLVWFAVSLNVVTFVIIMVPMFAICVPLQGLWNTDVPTKCIATALMSRFCRASGCLAVVQDFICATIPFLIVRRLNMKRSKKRAIATTLGLGYIVTVCTIVRTIVSDAETSDLIKNFVVPDIFNDLELGIAVIVASIPPISSIVLSSWLNLSTGLSLRFGSLSSPRAGSPQFKPEVRRIVPEDWDISTGSNEGTEKALLKAHASNESMPSDDEVKGMNVTIEALPSEPDDLRICFSWEAR